MALLDPLDPFVSRFGPLWTHMDPLDPLDPPWSTLWTLWTLWTPLDPLDPLEPLDPPGPPGPSSYLTRALSPGYGAFGAALRASGSERFPNTYSTYRLSLSGPALCWASGA